MTEQDRYTHEMTYHRGCRRSDDTPSEALYEHDVEQEVHHIIYNNSHRHQLGFPVDTHHRGESPHEDEGGITQQQHLHVITCQGQDMLIATEHTRRLIRECHTPDDGEQHPYPSAQHQCPREEPAGIVDIILSQGISHQHAGTRIDKQVEREDELVDGLGEVDGTHTILIDEVTHDDTIYHIP